MTDNGGHSFTEGSEPIKLTERIEKERLAKQAEEHLRNTYSYNDIDLMPPSDTEKMVDCYIAGAIAERERNGQRLDQVQVDYYENKLESSQRAIDEMYSEIQELQQQLKEERNKAIDECIGVLDKYIEFGYVEGQAFIIKAQIESLKSDSK